MMASRDPALRLMLARIAELESQVAAYRGALAALAGAPSSPSFPCRRETVPGGLSADELFAFDEATDDLCVEGSPFVQDICDALREAGQ